MSKRKSHNFVAGASRSERNMVAKVSLAKDTSEDTVLLLPGKKFGKMFADGETEHKLKLSQKVAYGFGHVMNDICAAMWFSYTLLFFKVVLEMPPIIAGTMIFLGQLADAVGSPIIGILVDRYGTRKSWHMTGTCLIAFSFSLIFSKCPWGPNFSPSVNGTADIGPNNSWDFSSSSANAFTSLYYAVFVTIFQIGWAMVQIAHLAIIPEMTPDNCGRTDLTSIRYTATVCSSVFVYIATWFILHFAGGSKDTFGPKDFFKFKDIVIIGLLTGGLFTLFFHVLVKTPNESKSVSNLSPKSAGICLSRLKYYFKSSKLYQVTIIYFCSRMLLSINLLYMPLYLENNNYESETLAIVPLVSYIASFLGSLIIGRVKILCHSKVNYFVGALISIGASVWIEIGLVNIGELLGVSALLGLGSSITGVASLCLCAELIGTDTDNGAFIYSVVTAVDKLLEGVAVIVIEKYKELDESMHYYKDILSYGCGICSVSGLIILLSMCFNSTKTLEKDINDETVTE